VNQMAVPVVDRRAGPEIKPDADLPSDVSLVHELVSGSEAALGMLYDRYSGAVLGAAMRASGDHAIAAEVVQETFLALWDRAELFDASRGSLSAWLTRIAHNRAIDRLRAAARHDRAVAFSSFGQDEADDEPVAEWLMTAGELIGAAGPEPTPESALVDKETRASIEEALGSLGLVERQVIGLAYGDGLSQSEIASRLGWPIGTVKTRTRRALRHLRDRLEPPAPPLTANHGGAGRERPLSMPHAALARVPAVVGRDCLAPC